MKKLNINDQVQDGDKEKKRQQMLHSVFSDVVRRLMFFFVTEYKLVTEAIAM